MGASRPTATRRSPGAGDLLGEKGARSDPSVPRTVTLIDGRRVGVDVDASNDARISLIAERQRGCVSRRQLLHAGVERSAIKRRLRNGRLDLVHRGVYRLPHTAGLPLATETAALLACGERAVLSHHSAATLWGLRVGVARPVHVTIPGNRGCPAPEGVRIHRSVTLAGADVRLHDGLPCTSPARTILDVAATLTDRDVEQMVDDGLFVQRILTVAQLRDTITRAGRHPGRARLTRVAANHTRTQRTDSPPEERLLQLLRAAGLPEPSTQVPILDYRLDFFWAELRLAVEVDAYGTHGSPSRFEGDRRRDARLLTEKGITVIRLTRAAIEERPGEALALIARAIGRREAALGA